MEWFHECRQLYYFFVKKCWSVKKNCFSVLVMEFGEWMNRILEQQNYRFSSGFMNVDVTTHRACTLNWTRYFTCAPLLSRRIQQKHLFKESPLKNSAPLFVIKFHWKIKLIDRMNQFIGYICITFPCNTFHR